MLHSRYRHTLVLLVAAVASCSDYKAPTAPVLPVPAPPAVQLKDIIIETLPLPFTISSTTQQAG